MKHSENIEYHHDLGGWCITKADADGEQDIILARLDVPSSDDPTLTDDEQKANGTLWAAAPRLLAAAKATLDALEAGGTDTGMGGPLSDLRDAVDAAEGGR